MGKVKDFFQKTIKKIPFEKIPFINKIQKLDRFFIGLIFFLILTVILTVDLFPQQVDLEVGQVSDQDIFASKSTSYVDEAATEKAKNDAAADIADVYVNDSSVQKQVKEQIDTVIQNIQSVLKNEALDDKSKSQQIAKLLPVNVSDSTLAALTAGNSDDLTTLQNNLTELINDAYSDNITAEDLEQIKTQLTTSLQNYKMDSCYVVLASGLLDKYVKANYYYDEKNTELQRKQAMDGVDPIQITIQKGQKIIGIGDIVTVDHLSELEALGLMKPQMPLSNILGVATLVLLSMVLVMIYLYHFKRDLYQKNEYLTLLGIIVVVILIIAKGLVAIDFSKWSNFSDLTGYMVPVGAASMMIAILVNSHLAILVTALLSLMISQIAGNDLSFAIVSLIGGVFGVFSVNKLSQRSDLVKAGLYVGFISMLTIASMGLMKGETLQVILISALLFGALNGFLTSVLTIGIMPYLESIFGITSAIKLLELSNPSHPLLKRLLLEAPGTYHHSIIVGNLAEGATDVIGGDSLVVRVGSYYHDIGKIKRPYFFIENQIGEENPHDKLSPDMSALILTCHTKDGVSLAIKYNLPQVIIDIIKQHHGTCLASFFYNKALDSGLTVNEDEFHYEGPKPQTKEAAIVMLADSVEAAVRSIKNPTMERIEEMVNKIIWEKMNERQLDEADITMKDLDKISKAFMTVLRGIYHQRIEYPEKINQEDILMEMKGRE